MIDVILYLPDECVAYYPLFVSVNISLPLIHAKSGLGFYEKL